MSLVSEDKVHHFIEEVRRGFFSRPEWQGQLGEILFASKPGNGALLLKTAEFSKKRLGETS